jgi:hypothetical protein
LIVTFFFSIVYPSFARKKAQIRSVVSGYVIGEVFQADLGLSAGEADGNLIICPGARFRDASRNDINGGWHLQVPI